MLYVMWQRYFGFV